MPTLMESVYLETSFISYLVARPSRDVLVVAHQRVTRDWWDQRRRYFECFVSQVVIDEASAGDPEEAAKRMAVVGSLPVLELKPDVNSLTKAIMATGAIPTHAVGDAAHVAAAAIHRIDYLLTWNCKHLANAQITPRIKQVCDRLGRHMPSICTPEELMGT